MSNYNAADLPAYPAGLIYHHKVNVYQLLDFIWMILKAEMQTVGDKPVISGLCWYASDQYGLLITVGGVGGDFSQTDYRQMSP